MKKLIPIIALPITLVVLYGLDLWHIAMQAFASRTFQVEALFWSDVAIALIFAASMLVLFWLATSDERRSWWAGAVYLVTGLILLLSMPLSRVAGRIFSMLLIHWTTSGIPIAGAFITLIGLYALLPIRRSSSE